MVLRTGLTTLLLLMLLTYWTQWTERGVCAIRVPVRCECVKELQAVLWRDISHVAIMPETQFCKAHMRVTLKNKMEVCLNPSSEQAVSLKKCWPKVGQSKARRKSCLRPAKPPKTKGPARRRHKSKKDIKTTPQQQISYPTTAPSTIQMWTSPQPSHHATTTQNYTLTMNL